jgi:hypothetical protein
MVVEVFGRFVMGIVVALALGACNWFYGLEPTELNPVTGGGTDLDLDSVPDDMDPCIAAKLDETEDYDRDLLPNLSDPCPFDDAMSQNGNPDTDQDGISDACDPFPQVPGDTRRCMMRFYNQDLNARLWHETDATPTWSSVSGALVADDDGMASTLAATLDLESSMQPTFDADVIAQGDPFAMHGVRMWARAADPASRDDVGCEIYGDRTYTRIAVALGDGRDIGMPMNLIGTPFPLSAALRIQLTLIPATGEIRCTISRFPDRWQVTAKATLIPGRLGFGSEGVQTQVTGLAIYDRQNVQPLP